MTDWLSLESGARIFLIGIGGISMSGLAEIAHAEGYIVAGSDIHLNQRIDRLAEKGIRIYNGHKAEWIDQFRPDLVVHTAAVHEDNPEWIHSKELGIPVIDRAQFLGWINRSYPCVINIAGTHGKTTTTAICSLILIESGLDPTVHLGAELSLFQGTVRTGQKKQMMVSEACEYMNSFLHFYSTTAAVLNIDYDHVDCFPDLDSVIDAFTAFSDRLSETGYLVIPDFDPHVERMLEKLSERRKGSSRKMPRLVLFGLEDNMKARKTIPEGCSVYATYIGRNLSYEGGLPRFEIWHNGRYACQIRMLIPGFHNVHDALAAVACAHLNGGRFDAAERVLNQYRGAEGRFTDIGTYRGARVIADYAHHPAAARMTLAAAKAIPHRHLWVVFQPLTFSRTKVLFDDYVSALKDCEAIIFSEIYSDRETNPGDISSRMLADRINELGGNAWFAEQKDQIRLWLNERVGPEDLILVMGPENIRDYADVLTGRLHHLDQPATR